MRKVHLFGGHFGGVRSSEKEGTTRGSHAAHSGTNLGKKDPSLRATERRLFLVAVCWLVGCGNSPRCTVGTVCEWFSCVNCASEEQRKERDGE